MKKPVYPALLFWLFVLILALPLLNMHLDVVHSGKLNGAASATPDTTWTFGGWWSGALQRKKEAHINDSIGFRPDLVRLNNQLDFSLFRKLHASGVVLGKDGYLFEEGYINVYCAQDYNATAEIRRWMLRLRAVQDSMEARGKVLLFVLAPSKARYFAEAIPANLACPAAMRGPYPDVRRLADSLGIHTLDVNRWFLKQKGKTPYPLFTKSGIHWSNYGSVLAIDTLLKHLARYTKLPTPLLRIDSLRPTRTRFRDDQDQDIESALNLIYPLNDELLARPDYTFVPRDSSGARKPKIIFLGDSFVWSWIYRNLPQSISDGWEFWYYFNEVWNGGDPTPMQEWNWRASLDSANALIMTYTEINVASGASGFVDSGYHYFVKGRKR